MQTIGERIKFLREKHNISQKGLADATGLQRGNLSHYEKNKIKPSAEAIVALASFFDVSTDWLLTGKENERKRNGSKDRVAPLIQALDEEERAEVEQFVEFLIYRRNSREEMQKEKPPSRRPQRKVRDMELAGELAKEEKGLLF